MFCGNKNQRIALMKRIYGSGYETKTESGNEKSSDV